MRCSGVTTAILLMAISAPSGPMQSLREVARAKARTEPGGAILKPVPPVDYEPTTIENLSKHSRVVLIGTVTRVRTHLGPADDRVLTDYRISAPDVIAGELPSLQRSTPGETPALTFSVLGGEVVVEGITIRSPDSSRQAIRDGAKYLLFLRDSPEPSISRFDIYNGGIFEVSGSVVTPLLKKADQIFENALGLDLQAMRALVRQGRESR